MLVGEQLAAALLVPNPLFSLLFHWVPAVLDKLDVRAEHRTSLSAMTRCEWRPNLDNDGVVGERAVIGGQSAEAWTDKDVKYDTCVIQLRGLVFALIREKAAHYSLKQIHTRRWSLHLRWFADWLLVLELIEPSALQHNVFTTLCTSID